MYLLGGKNVKFSFGLTECEVRIEYLHKLQEFAKVSDS